MKKSKSEVLALIPARGGSKGIPRKNLIEIAGEPLIAYSITQALSSRMINRTIVSTEDEEIADVSRKYGAEIPFMRPLEFAQDTSPDLDVFYHALTWLRDEEGYECDIVVHLRPTGPIRKINLIDEAIEMLQNHPEACSLRSVSKPIQTPYKMWRIEDGYLDPIVTVEGMSESYCQPRQILPEIFWQNGYIDLVRSETILEKKLMCGHKILPFVISEPIYELDYEDDISMLEEAMNRLKKGKELSSSISRDRYPV
jgi:CMP-N,N'-diacetyllegionaminic acid synthase